MRERLMRSAGAAASTSAAALEAEPLRAAATFPLRGVWDVLAAQHDALQAALARDPAPIAITPGGCRTRSAPTWRT